MDGGARQDERRGRGVARLVEDYAAIGRVTGHGRPSARARLEYELGLELTRLLVGALAGSRGRLAVAV